MPPSDNSMTLTPLAGLHTSSSGWKNVRRDRSAAYRRIKHLEARVSHLQSVNNMLKKRLSRQRQTQASGKCNGNLDYKQNTARKSARLTMGSLRKMRRALIYH